MDIPPAIIAPAVVEVRVPTVRGDVIDSERMIACLLQVEGNRWTDPGGALGFQSYAWHEDTGMPYSYAQRKVHAYAVAKLRIARFIAECAEIGLYPKAEHVGEMWVRGFEQAISKLRRAGTFAPLSYGRRVANLYGDLNFRP